MAWHFELKRSKEAEQANVRANSRPSTKEPRKDERAQVREERPLFEPLRNWIRISDMLQPPVESGRGFVAGTSLPGGLILKEDFSFLEPPFSDDSVQLEKAKFESMKMKGAFKSFESVTFSPRTEMVLEMMRARALVPVPRPANFLEPPEPPGALPKLRFRADNYPYVETLRSIQKSGPFGSQGPGGHATRTVAPGIFEAPSQPLLSTSELEPDPYYPKEASTTEAYYTPRGQEPALATTRRPFPTGGPRFEIPAVLPDLNSLEDLLDRRKFFFIPARLKST